MKNQITLEQALELVEFRLNPDGKWFIKRAKGDVDRVEGHVNRVEGDVIRVDGFVETVEKGVGTVLMNVGTVNGVIHHTINGRQWQYVESPNNEDKS